MFGYQLFNQTAPYQGRSHGFRLCNCVRVALWVTLLATLFTTYSTIVFAKPFSVSEFRTLEFADVAGSSQGPGTVTITTTGNKSTTGFALNFGGNHRAAQFKVANGTPNGTVLITLPTSVTMSNGASLHSFVSDPPAGIATLDNKGKMIIRVGATMDLPTNPSGGDISASFTIFVDEQ